ncbi:hypothetical protein [Salinivibrio sp. VYel6]|uniref:hypothetical protein n=1 Tax=Salinivibrio sp. VYel6 TaxID=2490493 RepID=UPI001C12C766
MLINARLAVTGAFFAVSVHATEWPTADFSWQDSAPPPPEVHPFELPTLNGHDTHFNTAVPALKTAPRPDTDAIYRAITHCYPEKSKFNIDINIVAGMKSSLDQYSTDNWPEISEHYVGIVGKMPLYSSTEQSRERNWEYQRRTNTATAVASFANAVANRNHAYRMMGLYMALEARAQARVTEGIANVNEQVGYLEKVAGSQRDVLQFEAKVTEFRLALAAMCDDTQQAMMNDYLKKVAKLPSEQPQ